MGNRNSKKISREKHDNIAPIISTTITDVNQQKIIHSTNGRRYNKDDQEIDRLQAQHYILRHIWDNNYSAPVTEWLENGCFVLDVACGPGIWIFEMASNFPNSTFIGVDESHIFPKCIKPINTAFIQTNLITGLPFDDNTFDYIHARLMLFCLTESDWMFLIGEILRILKPGGVFESHELDFEMEKMGETTTMLVDNLIEVFLQKDINIKVNSCISKYMSDQNFKNIQKFEKSGAYGQSGGSIGEYALEDFKLLFTTFGREISSLMDITEPGYLELLKFVDKEVDENETFYKFFRIIGFKPM